MQLLRFIREHVPSVWALRLLLLIRTPPLRTWSPGELVRELRASDLVVANVLSRFQDDGLVVIDPERRYRFAAERGLDDLCDALADAYRLRPFAVRRAIMAPDNQLTELADAFRIKDRRE